MLAGASGMSVNGWAKNTRSAHARRIYLNAGAFKMTVSAVLATSSSSQTRHPIVTSEMSRIKDLQL